ncbi:hypothetical protein GGQ74_001245 [Desulfobaculum xiamenense]|uniref:Uncharacterized protein n=1 Tax=Desulfobaculum xiamenense TaxID=995050 RepID=A0A846QQD1_9BACT|nr:hypothetical protein [Desulfobaculum xiamenense]NJB67605.1 hypothetical protein [Desulfobaculum xiamenense]
MLFNRRRDQAVTRLFYHALQGFRAKAVLEQAVEIHQRRCTNVMEQREDQELREMFAAREVEASKRRNVAKMAEAAKNRHNIPA